MYPTAANANAVAPTPPPSVTTVVSQRLDFDALHDLISRACSHRPLYERLYSQVFVSSLRQVVPKLHFNIEKVPREQRTPGTLQKVCTGKGVGQLQQMFEFPLLPHVIV